MIPIEFLLDFKRRTEEKWGVQPLNPLIYGFQFQAGTRWDSGLSEEQIKAYEADVDIHFPNDLRVFLRVMNGTKPPTINTHGSSGEPSREGLGVYSYPRDLGPVRSMIGRGNLDRRVLAETMADQGFSLSTDAKLMPIFAHRFVVCNDDPESSSVLSIWDSEDAIVYGCSLQEYLEREFLGVIPARAR